MTMKMSERIDCISEMPAALMAVSSELSPRLPKAMSEESRMASGNACGMSIRPMYQKNCASTSRVRPLPISSSTYRHRNCIISTNWQMKKVPANSSPNCLAMKISSFLMRNILSLFCISLQNYEENVKTYHLFIFFIPFYGSLCSTSFLRLSNREKNNLRR